MTYLIRGGGGDVLIGGKWTQWGGKWGQGEESGGGGREAGFEDTLSNNTLLVKSDIKPRTMFGENIITLFRGLFGTQSLFIYL